MPSTCSLSCLRTCLLLHRATREAEALAKALAARGHEYERKLDVRAAVQVRTGAACARAGAIAPAVLQGLAACV